MIDIIREYGWWRFLTDTAVFVLLLVGLCALTVIVWAAS